MPLFVGRFLPKNVSIVYNSVNKLQSFILPWKWDEDGWISHILLVLIVKSQEENSKNIKFLNKDILRRTIDLEQHLWIF